MTPKINPIILYTDKLSHKNFVPIYRITKEDTKRIEIKASEVSKYFNAISIPSGARESKAPTINAPFNSWLFTSKFPENK